MNGAIRRGAVLATVTFLSSLFNIHLATDTVEICNQFCIWNWPEQGINTMRSNLPERKAPKALKQRRNYVLFLNEVQNPSVQLGFLSPNVFLLLRHFNGYWDEMLLPVPSTIAEGCLLISCMSEVLLLIPLRKQLFMSTKEKGFSYPCLFTFRKAQRHNVSLLLLWEWIEFTGRAECLVVRAEKGIRNYILYGSNSTNHNPGFATDWPYTNYFLFVSFNLSEAVWMACFKVLLFSGESYCVCAIAMAIIWWWALALPSCGTGDVLEMVSHIVCSNVHLCLSLFLLLFEAFFSNLGFSPPKPNTEHKIYMKLVITALQRK